jgi:hypothetical protein
VLISLRFLLSLTGGYVLLPVVSSLLPVETFEANRMIGKCFPLSELTDT